MNRPTLLLIHGWGFDAALWDPLRECLAGHNWQAADLGYFGNAYWPRTTTPNIVVTHSLGTMLALHDPPAECIGLVAINGFDRFAEQPGKFGVPRRLIDRMLARFDTQPGEVLREFRARCGARSAAFQNMDVPRLRAHLEMLRDADLSGRVPFLNAPILMLQGKEDPILPSELHDGLFAGAREIRRITHPSAGHLLPLSHPQWCADQMRRFLEQPA